MDRTETGIDGEMELDRVESSADDENAPRITVVIPTWNKCDLVVACLESLEEQIYRGFEVIVVDDGSTDGTADTMAKRFPGAKLIRLDRNRGFCVAVNAGIRAAETEFVFLLNNDLILRGDFFSRLDAARRRVEEPSLFAIGAKTLRLSDGRPNHIGMHARWKGGMIVQEAFDAEVLAPTDFFQAGACLFRRDHFGELGGFLPLFYPGYWEDYDLAYRALKRGWKNYYEPRAVADHVERRAGDL